MISGTPCPSSCGNGMLGMVMVPVGMMGGTTGTPGGAATSAPAVAYVPVAGSVLAGKTDLGSATDKIADLLKLLNNAGFASAPDSSVVYNATTKQFEPSANPLSTNQLDALLKALYNGGAAGSILQIAADGTVDAVPFLAGLKAGAPGTAAADILRWDAVTSTWVVGSAAPSVAAAINAALASTTTGTNVPVSLGAVNAAGTLVKTAIVPIPAVVPGVYAPANNISAPASTVVPVATATVPADGWYIMNITTAGFVKSKGMAITPVENLVIYATNGPLAAGKPIYSFNYPLVLQAARATTAGEILAQFRVTVPSEPFYALAGTVVNTAVYTPAFVSDLSFLNLEASAPNGLQRISSNYLV